MGIIAILTDFGLRDHYNGVMKGVILSIDPEARIVDLAPDAPSFSILDAAFMLWASYRYFPAGTIFLVVVDPGVGTSRAALAVKGKRHFFVGPDNGVLYPAASEDGIETIVKIAQGKYTLPSRSGTFDGRDVFAPASAWLSRGVSVKELGEETGEMVKLEIGRAELRENEVIATVIHVDRFGDVVTNIPSSMAEGIGSVVLRGRALRVADSFSSCGELCMVRGSSGFLEIASNMGSAADMLGVKTGDRLTLFRVKGK